MEQLIELLKQIQDLAGAGIDALKGATEGGGKEPGGAPPDGDENGGAPPPEKGAPPA
jgi:hypothetical protein